MRGETRNWWTQALADLEAARAILLIGQYYVCAFLCHQAAEKALKAVIIEKLRELPPKNHNLLRLGERLSLTEGLQAALRRLNPAYTNARYPDAANGVPAEAFDEGMAKDHIAYSERVVEWARKQLGL
ncbi:MAG: HEPN domain-containing protein [Dehalococcoidia bacterium]|nr:MAG: HEPN domain-containing protein [Dehalococcoidia bacterium]